MFGYLVIHFTGPDLIQTTVRPGLAQERHKKAPIRPWPAIFQPA
jgi:hypothetical protein